MFDIKIAGKEKFKLGKVLMAADAEGKVIICVNYCIHRGPKNSLSLTFEGFAKNESVKIKEEYSFASLMKMFDDKRIYPTGVVFLEGQFEKGIAKSE